MELIYFFVGLLILAISLGFAIKNRHNTKKWIANLTVGIFFSTIFNALPTEWVKEGKTVVSEFWYSAVSSLFYSFKALPGRADIAQLESIPFTGWLKSVYIAVNYISFVAAPVLASTLLLSFFGDTLQKIRYHLRFSNRVCIISELNNNSLELAKSIKREKGRKTIVFCKTKKVEDDLIGKARKAGFILLYKECTGINITRRRIIKPHYEFYLLAEDEDNNIHYAESFIAKRKKYRNMDIKINAFTQGGTNVAILENMLKKPRCFFVDGFSEKTYDYVMGQKLLPDERVVFYNASSDLVSPEFKSDKFIFKKCPKEKIKLKKFSTFDCIDLEPDIEEGEFKENKVHICKNRFKGGWPPEKFQLRFINEIALFCDQLIYEHPLYTCLPEGSNKISVLIAGCGYWGVRMLKTVIWAGQIDGYSLKIRIFDRDAGQIEKEFYQSCPELNPHRKKKSKLKKLDIAFKKVDFLADNLFEELDDCADATYVCVATGSDDLNLNVAENLYRVLRIKNNFSDYSPPIFTRIRKNSKSNNYGKEGSYLDKRNIHLFGTAESYFEKTKLFNSQLENLALATHLCYNDAFKASKDSAERLTAERKYYSSEYNRRSSMAAALHFGAKILMCCGVKEDQFSDDAIEKYRACNNGEKSIKLSENEHERWSYFMASEGYEHAEIEQVESYYGKVENHKDELSKLHPCITDMAGLRKFTKEYERISGKDAKDKFVEYDKAIVNMLPEMVEAAKNGFKGE